MAHGQDGLHRFGDGPVYRERHSSDNGSVRRGQPPVIVAGARVTDAASDRQRPREVVATLMIPQPVDAAPEGADLDRTVRRRWRDRRLTGRPEAPRDPDAQAYVIHVTPLPAAGPVDAARVRLHTALDAIARHRAMCGLRVDHVLGWDCHHPSVPADAPRDAVAAHVDTDVRARRALACDDAVHTFRTMDATYVDSVWWALAQLTDAGLLHEVTRSTGWCAGCRRDAGPVTSTERSSSTALVRFPVVGDNALCTAGASLLVTVEDPAELPAVGAVTTATDGELVLAHAAGDAYPVVLARDAVTAVLGHDVAVHREVTAGELRGLSLRNPAAPGGARVRVMAGSTPAATTTGLAPVANDDRAGGGTRDAILRDLRDRGLLLREDDRRLRVDLCGTCGAAVDRLVRTDWAIDTSVAADRLRSERAEVAWHGDDVPAGGGPDPDRARVVSRRGRWGTPLPLWRCADCREVTVVAGSAQLVALAGCEIDDVDVRDPSSVDAVTFACPRCPDGTARHVSLLVDAGFEAGVMPFARFGFPGAPGSDAYVARRCHTDLVVDPCGTADDVLTISTLLWDANGYDAVLAIVGDGAPVGIDVPELCARHGADAVRWAALTTPDRWGTGNACDDLARAATDRLISPLRDACAAFTAVATDVGWTPADGSDADGIAARGRWDRWILADLADTVTCVRRQLDALDLAGAGRRIGQFVYGLSRWRAQRTPEGGRAEDPADRACALATFHECLVTVAALLAPFTPLVSDELFEQMVRATEPAAPDSVHLLRYPMPDPSARDEKLRHSMRADGDREVRLARDVIRAVNELREHEAMNDDQRIMVRIDADAEVAAAVETHRRTIADDVLATRIELGPTDHGVPVPLGDARARMALRRAAG